MRAEHFALLLRDCDRTVACVCAILDFSLHARHRAAKIDTIFRRRVSTARTERVWLDGVERSRLEENLSLSKASNRSEFTII